MRCALVNVFMCLTILFIIFSCRGRNNFENDNTLHYWYKKDFESIISLIKGDSIIESGLVKSIPFYIRKIVEISEKDDFNLADSNSFIWESTDAKTGSLVDTNLTEIEGGIGFTKSDTNTSNFGLMQMILKVPDKKLLVYGQGKKSAYLSFIKGGFISKKKLYIFSLSGENVKDFWFCEPDVEILNTDQVRFYLENVNSN